MRRVTAYTGRGALVDGLDEREYRLLQSRRAGNMHGCDESSPPVPLYEGEACHHSAMGF